MVTLVESEQDCRVVTIIRTFTAVPGTSSIYACMVITYSRVWIIRVRLTILHVVSGKLILSCPHSRLRIWFREAGSVVPSRVSLLISIIKLNLELTYEIPPDFRVGVHLLLAFTAESPPAQGQ